MKIGFVAFALFLLTQIACQNGSNGSMEAVFAADDEPCLCPAKEKAQEIWTAIGRSYEKKVEGWLASFSGSTGATITCYEHQIRAATVSTNDSFRCQYKTNDAGVALYRPYSECTTKSLTLGGPKDETGRTCP